ncbi:MAG TPA: hypothetical protein VIN59_05835 [Alphaproteobacteria bacterium]
MLNAQKLTSKMRSQYYAASFGTTLALFAPVAYAVRRLTDQKPADIMTDPQFLMFASITVISAAMALSMSQELKENLPRLSSLFAKAAERLEFKLENLVSHLQALPARTILPTLIWLATTPLLHYSDSNNWHWQPAVAGGLLGATSILFSVSAEKLENALKKNTGQYRFYNHMRARDAAFIRKYPHQAQQLN